MRKLLTILLSAVIFLAPTNLFFRLSEDFAYVNGLRVDYLIPKLYLSHLFVIFFLLAAAVAVIRDKNIGPAKITAYLKKNPYKILLLIFCLSAIVVTTIIAAPASGGWQLASSLAATLFSAALIYLFSNNNFLSEPLNILPAIIVTVLFQAAVGIAQFVMQSSIFGYLFLGEVNIAGHAGLAKSVIQGRELVLPYGTTAHPNVLAGFLAIYLLAIWTIILKRKHQPALTTLFSSIATIAGMIALILTFSVSGWLTLMAGILLIWSKSKNTVAFLGLAIVIAAPMALFLAHTNNISIPSIDQDSFLRRSYLNSAAAKMALSNPAAGVGINSFTRYVEQYSSEREVVRFVQPVHHSLLLWAAETGAAGIFLIAMLAWLLKDSKTGRNLLFGAVVLSPIIALDHYLLSLFPGQLLLIITAFVTVPHFFQLKEN